MEKHLWRLDILFIIYALNYEMKFHNKDFEKKEKFRPTRL